MSEALQTQPTVTPFFGSKEAQVRYIADRFCEILQALDIDLSHPSLRDTPDRVAKMYVHELFSGLEADNFPELTYFDEPCATGQVIRIEDIDVTSTCEHHLMPIVGTALVAYMPRKRVLGLSKVHRLVDYFARRPQLQERLTAQIADALSNALSTADVAVQIRAWHGCVACRGIKHRNSQTTTQILNGRFRSSSPFLDNNRRPG